MKQRFVRGLVAATLAVTISLPGTATPAVAWDLATIGKYIELAAKAYDLISKVIGGGGMSIEEATRQIIAKIEESKVQILNHIDAIATAEASACARHHVIELADIERFNPDVLQRWAQDATGCAVLIDSLIPVVQDKSQADLLGLALNVAGSVALTARVRAGFGTAGLTDTLRRANNATISKLFPTCSLWTQPEPGSPITTVFYECVAHNGDTARGAQRFRGSQPVGPPIDRVAVENRSTRGTARAVAQATLPYLNF